MVFEVSTAKREILEKLTEQSWTPTDLAEELDKSPNTIYNHLDDLYDRGVLAKQRMAAKTRPKTEYSIGDGFIQYIAVLPGQYSEKSFPLTPEKQAILRIWSVPQDEFHPFVADYWWRLKHGAGVNYREDVTGVAIYGSVARGAADDDSDLDFLVLTRDTDTKELVSEQLGSLRIKADDGTKIAMTEVFSMTEYRDSLAHGSSFLERIRDELHVLYDPETVLQHPEQLLGDEQ